MSRSDSRSRAELSREKIIGAALDLIDRNGMAALNMRTLGQAVGSATMSVYRYFPSKSELLDAVVDHVVEGFAPKEVSAAWPEEARALCLRVRGAMLAHPELADLIGRELRRSPTSLSVNTAIIGRLRSVGVPRELLPDTYWALSSYTTGYTLLEAQTYRHRRPDAKRSSAAERARKLAALLEIADGLSQEESDDAAMVLSRPLDEVQFLFGLDCVIAGLSARFAAHKEA
jgi:AcrR family transcriptional regulator